jgi:hypothetical protein
MNAYQIVQIAPAGYSFSHCLDDIARLLSLSFESLGLPVTRTENLLGTGRTNVLIGYHLVDDPAPLAQVPYVVYQLEQLSDREGWFSSERLHVLRGAQEVWDYCPQNVAFLHQQGVAARLLPIGYHPGLEVIEKDADEDIDVLFYGSLNERRSAVLDQLAGLSVMRLFNCYGPERDRVIARSRIVLNVHYYEAHIMEQARVSYLLNNGRFVLSESCRDDPFSGTVPQVAYPELAAACRHYLSRPEERRRIARAGHEAFRARPMAESLREVLAIDTAPGR